MASAVVFGPVLNVDKREGVSTRDPQNPRAYRIVTARVLVAETDVVDVRVPDTIAPPIKGEDVAYMVELGTYSGRLQVSATAALDPGSLAAVPA